MDSYEKLIKMINNGKAHDSAFFVVSMDSPTSCKVNDLPLGKGDLYINEYLLEYRPLKKGDIVVLMKINSEKYAIICKVVEL